MDIAITVFAILLGFAVGSFLNVCIDRLPAKKSIITGRSHCDRCKRELAATELIPVLSYIMLKGRCRTCGAAIPKRVLLVEVATGILFGGLAFAYSLTPIAGLLILYGCILIVVFVIDVEHSLILDVVVFPSIAIALAAAAVMPPPWLGTVGPIPLINATLGAATGFAILFAIAIVSAGMGWGDVKYAAFMGAATGFPLVFVALFVSVVVGGIAAVVLLATRKRKRKQAIPFGPFLAVGTMATLLWGPQMLSWYVGLM